MIGIMGLLSTGAGLLKNSISNLTSGLTKQERKEVKAAKKQAKEDILSGKNKEKTPSGSPPPKPEGGKFADIVKKYWWIGAVVAVAAIVFFMLKKKPVGRTRRSGSRGSAWSKKMLAAKRAKKR